MKGKKVKSSERLKALQTSQVERAKVFKEFKAHLERGLSKDCFPLLSWGALQRLVEAFPEDFVMEEIEESMRKAQVLWEDIGYRQSQGTCLGNSRAWFYNMAHRYKWSERQIVETEHKGTVNVAIVNYSSRTSDSV